MSIRLRRSLMASVALLVTATLPQATAAAEASTAAGNLDLVRRLNEAFVSVAERVSPSVVVVLVRPKPGKDDPFDHSGILEMLPEGMRKELQERLEEERKQPRRREAPSYPPGVFPEQGSGVVVREDGYILTNGHVVENAEQIEVRFQDGRRFAAEVKGVDPESDVAVLKVDSTGLPAARLGDSSKVRVGEFAIAIGAPFKLDYSVTIGHISAKGRRVADDVMMMDQDFLQTDASINPGNSGGPLVNIEGEVIGINTLIRGMNTGIGFAVPVNLAREVSEALIERGRFSRAWLGVSIQSVADRPADTGSELPVRDGVVVTRILRDGPSWGSALQESDIIVEVGGEPVRDVVELKRQVSRKPAGKPLALEVFRGTRKLALTVTPGELPEDRMAAFRPRPRFVPPPEPEPTSTEGLGLSIRVLDAEAAARVGLEAGEGVLVHEVQDNSPASRRRIRAGDVITKVNRKLVRSPKEFATAMREADLRKGVPVTVVAEAGRRFEVLKQTAE